MLPDSSKNKTLRAAILECGGQTEELRSFARELAAGLAGLPAAGGENPLDVFISELVLSAADERRRTERRRHQMECIAAAKAKGVRFGRQRMALPEDFEECYQAWRDGLISQQEAAASCGMQRTSFRRAVLRKEQEEEASA